MKFNAGEEDELLANLYQEYTMGSTNYAKLKGIIILIIWKFELLHKNIYNSNKVTAIPHTQRNSCAEKIYNQTLQSELGRHCD